MFHNEIEDLQRTTLVVVDSDLQQDIGNAADATIQGLELVMLVTDNLGLNVGVGYLDGEYKNVDSDLTDEAVFGAVIPIGTSFAPGDSSQYLRRCRRGGVMGLRSIMHFR